MSWDEQTLSFAMLVDADPEDVIQEVRCCSSRVPLSPSFVVVVP